MLFKTIITGRLQFNSERSYNNALELYLHRGEVYYKNDIALKAEEVFEDETLALVVPRHICQLSEKTWKSTIHLLEYTAQFALSGMIEAWMVEDGKALDYAFIEPKSDKQAVQCFLKGRRYLKLESSPEEAVGEFTRAVKKFGKHAAAFLFRGDAFLKMGRLEEARADYDRSLELDPLISSAHLGLGKVSMAEEKWKEAIAHFTHATKHSIPLQSKYWVARRLKGESHLEIDEFEKASVEFKFFTKRGFKEGDPNHADLKKVYFDYGKALLALGKYEQAIQAFSESASYEEKSNVTVEQDELLILRGLARQKAGRDDFETDWRKAAKSGSARAKQLLAKAEAV